MQTNVRLYPLYAVCLNAHFWLPVYLLFYIEHLSLREAIWLEAIYFTAMPLLEVPSGYFSDRIGRKPTLVIAASALLASFFLLTFGEGFALLAVAAVLRAVGFSFNSGTDASFHHDSLAAAGLDDEFAEREARVSKLGFYASALCAIAGGLIAIIDLRSAFALSAAAAVVMLVAALRFTEPHAPKDAADEAEAPAHFFVQLRDCLAQLRQPTLAWLFGFAVLMLILNHVPYFFYQPYLKLVLDDAPQSLAWLTDKTPPVSGLHTGLTLLIGGWFASRSVRMRDRLGLPMTLLLATVLQGVIIGAMAWTPHLLIAGFALLRSAPRGIMTAPMNAAIVPRVPRLQRATYLSMQSLAGRLSFAALLGVFGFIAAGGDAREDWRTMQQSLLVGLGIAVVGLLLLVVTIRALRHRKEEANATPS